MASIVGSKVTFERVSVLAVVVEPLLEIALVVEQTDGDKGNTQVAAAFYVVARQHAETVAHGWASDCSGWQ